MSNEACVALLCACSNVPLYFHGVEDSLTRFWRRINITIGRGTTWEEWLVHPNGAGLEDDEVVAMAAMSDDDLDANMAVLQRQFTDQLMASLKHLGAP
ncbi:MAG: hypothetical protein ACPH93_06510 [Candidatus Poseidoniaceae archaeon]